MRAARMKTNKKAMKIASVGAILESLSYYENSPRRIISAPCSVLPYVAEWWRN